MPGCVDMIQVDDVQLPLTPIGVELFMVRRPDGPGRTVAVRGSCSCGARAFRPMILPPRVTVDQLVAAATMLVTDTRTRCASGDDLAPGCERQRRWRKVIRGTRAGRPPALKLVVP